MVDCIWHKFKNSWQGAVVGGGGGREVWRCDSSGLKMRGKWSNTCGLTCVIYWPQAAAHHLWWLRKEGGHGCDGARIRCSGATPWKFRTGGSAMLTALWCALWMGVVGGLVGWVCSLFVATFVLIDCWGWCDKADVCCTAPSLRSRRWRRKWRATWRPRCLSLPWIHSNWSSRYCTFVLQDILFCSLLDHDVLTRYLIQFTSGSWCVTRCLIQITSGSWCGTRYLIKFTSGSWCVCY